jgi:hypothetical protein
MARRRKNPGAETIFLFLGGAVVGAVGGVMYANAQAATAGLAPVGTNTPLSQDTTPSAAGAVTGATNAAAQALGIGPTTTSTPGGA